MTIRKPFPKPSAHRSPPWLLRAAVVALVIALSAVVVGRLSSEPPVAASQLGERQARLQSSRAVRSERVAPLHQFLSLPAVARHGAQAIRGWVGSAAGEALAAARVCAVCASCDISTSPPGDCSFSNALGEYALDVAPGMYRVSASKPGYLVASAQAGEAVRVDAGTDVDGVDLTLSPGTSSLVGRVLDATGGPVAEARVQVADIKYSVRPLVELITDTEGAFSAALPAGRVAIRAEAPGYVPALVYRQLPSADATLVLVPGSTLEGTVVDAETGQALAGVDVRATGSVAATLAVPATSGADGRFVLSGLEPGRYLLLAEDDHHRSDTPQSVEVGFGERVAGLVLPVLPGVSIDGHVLSNPSDEPCREGYVYLGPPSDLSLVNRLAGEHEELQRSEARAASVRSSALAQIDPLGRVRLRGLRPGRYFVTLECKGHVYQAGPVAVDVGSKDQTVTWRVAAGLGLIVLVKNELGEPVPHAELSLEFPPARSGRGTLMPLPVDESGRAHLAGSLYPGRYVIHPGGAYGVPPRSVELRPGDGTLEVKLGVPGASAVRVRVRSAEGKPVDDVHVLVRRHEAGPKAANRESSEATSARAGVSVGGGEFVAQSLAAGSYTVEVHDGVNAPTLAAGPSGKVLTLAPGEEALATAVLSCVAELSGVVVDEQGAPIPDAWVTATHEADGHESGESLLGHPQPKRVLSDVDGRFSLDGLCDGDEYVLRAVQYGGAAGQLAHVSAVAGLELTIREPGGLEGTVLAPDGTPVRDYSISVHHPAAQHTRGVHVRAKDGRFELENLPAGRVELLVHSAGLSGQISAVVPAGSRLRGLQLTLETLPEGPSGASSG